MLSEVATKADLQAGVAKMEVGSAKLEAKIETGLANTKTDLTELETRLIVQIMKAAALQFVLLDGLMTIFKFIG